MDAGETQHQYNIFVFGETLFTEGIAQTLNAQEGFTLVGQSSMLDAALEIIQTRHINLVIVDSTDQNKKTFISNLIFECPNLNFIFSDLANQSVQVVSSCLIQPKTSCVLTAIQLLQHKNFQQKIGRG